MLSFASSRLFFNRIAAVPTTPTTTAATTANTPIAPPLIPDDALPSSDCAFAFTTGALVVIDSFCMNERDCTPKTVLAGVGDGSGFCVETSSESDVNSGVETGAGVDSGCFVEIGSESGVSAGVGTEVGNCGSQSFVCFVVGVALGAEAVLEDEPVFVAAGVALGVGAVVGAEVVLEDEPAFVAAGVALGAGAVLGAEAVFEDEPVLVAAGVALGAGLDDAPVVGVVAAGVGAGVVAFTSPVL